MNICVVGTGYVGLSIAVGFASKGNKVICVDIDRGKVDMINRGVPPIFEKDLEEMLKEGLKNNLIEATADLQEAIGNSKIVFITVGTPSRKDGSIDLSRFMNAIKNIGIALKEKDEYCVVAVKSTVIPGTTEDEVVPVLEEKSGKKVGKDFGVCMNPEFLREGEAISDFLNPDRTVIGEFGKGSGDLLEKLYKDFNAPILRMDLKAAEMVKYASNSFLANKISFINEIGNICKELEIDVYEVAEGMGLDKRISSRFLKAGAGYGGSCLPKDVGALISKAKDLGYVPELLNAGVQVNEKQPLRMVELLKDYLGDLEGKEVGILGLSFKPGTDDVREAPSKKVARKLLEEGAKVKAYDPEAVENFKILFTDIDYCTPEEVLDSDATLIMTDWRAFENLDYSGKIIIDGRRIEKAKEAEKYEGVCW